MFLSDLVDQHLGGGTGKTKKAHTAKSSIHEQAELTLSGGQGRGKIQQRPENQERTRSPITKSVHERLHHNLKGPYTKSPPLNKGERVKSPLSRSRHEQLNKSDRIKSPPNKSKGLSSFKMSSGSYNSLKKLRTQNNFIVPPDDIDEFKIFSDFSALSGAATFNRQKRRMGEVNYLSPGPAYYTPKIENFRAKSPSHYIPVSGKRVDFARDGGPGPGSYYPRYYVKAPRPR